MKTNKISIVFAFITALMLPLYTGCMQWDDTDGPFFGSWHLQTIDIDGQPDQTYNSNPEIMISFAGQVFNLAYMERAEMYGTWVYGGEVLELNATYKAGNQATDTRFFNPYPLVMHFAEGQEIIQVSVTKVDKKTMQWQYEDLNGRLLTYNFKKYPD